MSDIITEVDSRTHACTKSSVSEEIDILFDSINRISTEADELIQTRIKQLTSIEETKIKQIIQQRQISINMVLKKGSFHIEDYEKYYRNLIEQYIQELEIEMTKRLDKLHEQLESFKGTILMTSQNSIEDLTIKIQNAKKEVIDHIHRQALEKIKQILTDAGSISIEKTPLGYEQLTKINLQIYSTVGTKEDEQGCDNIHDREKFINDIKNAKPHQPRIKRTVYLGSDYNTTLPRMKSP